MVMLLILGICIMAFGYALYLVFSSKPEESKEVAQLKTSLLSVEQDSLEFKNRYEKMHAQMLKLETDLEKKTTELNAREPLLQSLKADLVTCCADAFPLSIFLTFWAFSVAIVFKAS